MLPGASAGVADASASRAWSRARICCGVQARRRRWSRAITTPVAATPANAARPSIFCQRGGCRLARRSAPGARLDTAYCAEVIAVSYQAMGLLPARRRPGWYDAGRFWSGDDLRLSAGARLGGEIAVKIPAAQLASSLG